MIDALREQLPDLRRAAQAEPLGLYLHIPFCIDRCTYCSFVTSRDRQGQPALVAKLCQQLEAWGEALGHPRVDTLYLGGGTPSLLESSELEALWRAAEGAFDFGPLGEATLEANPGTLDPEWLEEARALGFDRLSLGVQTLDDELLGRLGRIHGGVQALDALECVAHARFRRISADLMVGIPGQNLDGVLEDAERLVAMGAEHLSVYLLDLDKACPLKAQVEAGRLTLPSEDAVADVFEALQVRLPELGLEPYEISNYGAPGQESRHNLRYWQRRPYLGLGPSAASQLGDFRWTESEVTAAWLEGRGAGELQELDAAEALAEVPLLGLRLHRGVDWVALGEMARGQGLAPLFEAWDARMARFQETGLVIREGRILRLSPRGMLVSNGILQTFL